MSIDEKFEKCVDCLRKDGYLIVDTHSRPNPRDQRLEIDIVAYDRASDALVFVLVRPHDKRDLITRMTNHYRYDALRRVRNAGASLIAREQWKGKVRLDCMDIYGDGSIDHAEYCFPYSLP